MNTRNASLLAIVVTAGILSALGSSLEERPPRAPPVPVDVEYAMSGPVDGLSRERETLLATVGLLDLSGSYRSTQGSRLSLDRTAIEIDSGSRFDLTITPKADDPLEGTTQIEISAPLDIGLATNPVAGQYTSLYDGTSTVITVAGNGVDVLTGSAASPERFGWDAFRALESDTAAPQHTRIASSALNMLRVLLRAALLAEDMIDDVEANRTVLEGMNVGSALELTCNNGSGDGAAERRLIWTGDATGPGQGSIGAGDNFESIYRNCLRTARSRFLDGNMIARRYIPATGSGLHTFGIDMDLRNLFVSETMIDIATRPSDTTPRLDGEFTLRYSETVVPSR